MRASSRLTDDDLLVFTSAALKSSKSQGNFRDEGVEMSSCEPARARSRSARRALTETLIAPRRFISVPARIRPQTQRHCPASAEPGQQNLSVFCARNSYPINQRSRLSLRNWLCSSISASSQRANSGPRRRHRQTPVEQSLLAPLECGGLPPLYIKPRQLNHLRGETSTPGARSSKRERAPALPRYLHQLCPESPT